MNYSVDWDGPGERDRDDDNQGRQNMRHSILVTSDGKQHLVFIRDIKSVEHVPGKAYVAPRPAQPARAADPGVPVTEGNPGRPPVPAQEARPAEPGSPAVQESVIIHTEDGELPVAMTLKHLHDEMNRPVQ